MFGINIYLPIRGIKCGIVQEFLLVKAAKRLSSVDRIPQGPVFLLISV